MTEKIKEKKMGKPWELRKNINFHGFFFYPVDKGIPLYV